MPPLVSALARRGIQLIPAAIGGRGAVAAGTLPHYDALLIYGDLTLTPEQQKAVSAFVDGGKGVLAVHSPALVGQVGIAAGRAPAVAGAGDRRDRAGRRIRSCEASRRSRRRMRDPRRRRPPAPRRRC